MKELGMSWQDIKATPRYELEGLLRGMSIFNTIHAFDGYDAKDIASIAKDKPHVRTEYNKSIETKEKYEQLIGWRKQKKITSFKDLM
tara:strand:- start:95 stop:355 length:261 start_codon:yes stop_codon:yes gene_type:complete